jgi:hypothetical protein
VLDDFLIGAHSDISSLRQPAHSIGNVRSSRG